MVALNMIFHLFGISSYRSRTPEVFYKKSVLKNFLIVNVSYENNGSSMVKLKKTSSDVVMDFIA